jgi:hypothetical protein
MGVMAREVDVAGAVQQLRQNLHFKVMDDLQRGVIVAVKSYNSRNREH